MDENITIEKCQESALKFKTKKSWRKAEPELYAWTQLHGMLKECCGHMKRSLVTYTYTKSDILAEARKYRCVHDWKIASKPTFLMARRLGKYFYKECVAHMKRRSYWLMLEKYSDENLLASAKKYESKMEWANNELNYYKRAKYGNKEFYEKCCSHMTDPYDRVARSIYVFEFKDNRAYVGLSNNVRRRKHDHETAGKIAELTKNVSATFKVLEENIRGKDLALQREQHWHDTYKANGWTMLNSMKCCSVGGVFRRRYTDEEILASARRYTCKRDWSKNEFSMTFAAARYGLWKQCIAHMPFYSKRKTYNPYTNDELLESAKKYGNKREWHVNEPEMVKYANCAGIYKQCVAHMPKLFRAKKAA